MRPVLPAGLLAWLLVVAGLQPALAQQWSELTAQQQEVLAPLADKWAEIPEQRRQKLLRGAERWNSLSPEEQSRTRQRFQNFPPATG
jgi:hypothetical protein